MGSAIHIFYGNQLIYSGNDIPQISKVYGYEVFNGCYIYDTFVPRWYRGDFSPCLIEDVPKQLQMMALVLNL